MEPGTKFCVICGITKIPQYARECPQCNEPLAIFTESPDVGIVIIKEPETQEDPYEIIIDKLQRVSAVKKAVPPSVAKSHAQAKNKKAK